MPLTDFPVDADPLADLPPVARKIVHAAMDLVARSGLKSFTLTAVTAEAGVYADSIRYYFGGIGGVLETIVSSLSHATSIRAMEISLQRSTSVIVGLRPSPRQGATSLGKKRSTESSGRSCREFSATRCGGSAWPRNTSGIASSTWDFPDSDRRAQACFRPRASPHAGLFDGGDDRWPGPSEGLHPDHVDLAAAFRCGPRSPRRLSKKSSRCETNR